MCHQSGQSVTRQFLTAKPSHTCLGLAPASRARALGYAIRNTPFTFLPVSCMLAVRLQFIYHRASPNPRRLDIVRCASDRFGPLHCDRSPDSSLHSTRSAVSSDRRSARGHGPTYAQHRKTSRTSQFCTDTLRPRSSSHHSSHAAVPAPPLASRSPHAATPDTVIHRQIDIPM